MIRHQTLQDKLEYYKVKKYSRMMVETLEAWKELQIINDILSTRPTKREIKEREKRLEKYFNEDGSLKYEPTEEELNEYFRIQEELDELAKRGPKIYRKDKENFEKEIVNKKRIQQLENFIRFESKPRTLKDRFELNNLLIYGETYFYYEGKSFRFSRRYFEERDALILEYRRSS